MGDNQTFIDELLAKLHRLDKLVSKDGTNFDEDNLRGTLAQAEKSLKFVSADSSTILTISNTADKALNDADYAVSVAKAKMANAGANEYEKLKEEKAKEDDKIREDLTIRLESVAKVPADALSVVETLVARDPERQERIQKALEEAKARNASKAV